MQIPNTTVSQSPETVSGHLVAGTSLPSAAPASVPFIKDQNAGTSDSPSFLSGITGNKCVHNTINYRFDLLRILSSAAHTSKQVLA